jgi:hypothetical protein
MMERRIDPRFPLVIHAKTPDSPSRVFTSTDVSTGGVYFLGDPGIRTGESMWLDLDLVNAVRRTEGPPPLCAEVLVARISAGPDGVPVGFGARWLTAISREDVAPLRDLLRGILSISTGFVQALKPQDFGGVPAYVFVFPKAGVAREGSPRGAGRERAAAETEGTMEPKRTRTGIYGMLSLTYLLDDGEYEGQAVKLLPHGMRIQTQTRLPDAYRSLTILIPVKTEKADALSLKGTVIAVKRAVADGPAQFEVELGIGNDPSALAAYRAILDKLSQTGGDRSQFPDLK